jgi:hypothetical protein
VRLEKLAKLEPLGNLLIYYFSLKNTPLSHVFHKIYKRVSSCKKHNCAKHTYLGHEVPSKSFPSEEMVTKH